MFGVLGLYNFGGVIKKNLLYWDALCILFLLAKNRYILSLFLLLKGSFSCREGYIQCKIVEVNFKWYHLCRSMGQFSIWQENLLSWFFKAVFFCCLNQVRAYLPILFLLSVIFSPKVRSEAWRFFLGHLTPLKLVCQL